MLLGGVAGEEEALRLLSEMSSLAEAQSLRWYLLSQGVEAWVDEDNPANPEVWILADDALAEAKRLFELFLREKDSPALKALMSQSAQEQRQKEKQRKKTKPQSYKDPDHMASYPVTLTLIVLSVVVFVVSLSKSSSLLGSLSFSQDAYSVLLGQKNFSEIARGQLWRLVTPAFIHGGLFHLFFNMVLLWQLGRAFELAFSSLRFLGFFLGVCVFSHTAYYLVAGPNFGGMSGVIYGLVGYFWVWERYGASPRTSDLGEYFGQWFLIWYCVCLGLSLVGVGLANTIHGVGAWVGLLCAYWQSGAYRQLRMQLRHSKSFRKEALIGLGLLALALLIDHFKY